MKDFVPAKANPFTIDRVHSIPFQFVSGNWEQHLDRLVRMKWRGAIVGRRGAGKSTLLRQLQQRMEGMGQRSVLVKIPHDRIYESMLERALERRESHVLLIDGLERMSGRDRRRLRRKTRGQAGLVVIRHHRSSLPIWFRCSTNLQLMETILAKLNQQSPQLAHWAHELFDQHRGNIRLVLRDLYDRYSEGHLPTPPSIALHR